MAADRRRNARPHALFRHKAVRRTRGIRRRISAPGAVQTSRNMQSRKEKGNEL
jgi:hypothetical protein